MIICTNCQHENPPGSRFCNYCGEKLPLICPNCSQQNPPGARFCNNCGSSLAAPSAPAETDNHLPEATHGEAAVGTGPGAFGVEQGSVLERFIPREFASRLRAARSNRLMEGERRVVTMLFCDVQGSTAAASQLDPEEWAEIINGAFEYMITPIYRYEGTVARLMGDAVLAFFGAPIAHEDDPQRAVLAGLEIVKGIGDYRERVQERWGMDFNVRVGINTGLVVVGTVGSDLRMEYTALGDAINLASRMEQTAQPGTVRVSEDTYHLVAPLFDFDDLGEVTVKGRDDPVRVYQVLGRKVTTGRLRGLAGLESPLVGREKEFDQLKSAVTGLERGLGWIVLLFGEAGLGKSRLIQELRMETKRGEAPKWFETTTLSYETMQPYGLFHRLLRRVCGIGVDDPPQVVREKFSVILENTASERRAQTAQALESLFGLQLEANQPMLEGETFKGQFYVVMETFWREWAAAHPTVLVFDDLHWADQASVDLLEHLFSLTNEVPLVLVCAMRADREVPAWKLKGNAETLFFHRHTAITLSPLSTSESNALVDNLLHVADLPANLRNRILEKAAGNPFFVEEVLRVLIEAGNVVHHPSEDRWIATRKVGEIDIPENLQSLILARIDRLQDDVRFTLQLASVIGLSFYFRVLQHIAGSVFDTTVDQNLLSLQRAELIREVSRLPELEYAFRHALIQEAAYRTILHRQRRDFHRQVGETLETLYSDRLDEFAPMLGYHFHQAQDFERGFRYYTIAGDQAYRLHAVKEAIQHYTIALQIAEELSPGNSSEQLKHLYLRRGRALEHNAQFEEALSNYDQLSQVAERSGDQILELAAIVAKATVFAAPTGKYDPRSAKRLSRQALELAEALEDYAAQAKSYWNLMLLNFFHSKGNVRQAIRYGERSIGIARQQNLKEQLAYTLNDISRAYLVAGDKEKARAVLDEARGLWRELGDKAMLVDNTSTSALEFFSASNYEKVIEESREALQISRDIGNLWGQSYSQYALSFVYLERGEVDIALKTMQDCLRLGEEAGFIVPSVDINCGLALLYGVLGDPQGGLVFARLGMEKTENLTPGFKLGPRGALGYLYLQVGDINHAEKALEGLQPEDFSLNTLNSTLSSVLAIVALGALELAKGAYERVFEFTSTMIKFWEKSNYNFFAADALLLESQALLARGRMNEAYENLLRAYELGRDSRRVKLEVLPALYDLELQRGDREAAENWLNAARDNIIFIRDHISDPDLRASFLSRKLVRKMLENEP